MKVRGLHKSLPHLTSYMRKMLNSTFLPSYTFHRTHIQRRIRSAVRDCVTFVNCLAELQVLQMLKQSGHILEPADESAILSFMGTRARLFYKQSRSKSTVGMSLVACSHNGMRYTDFQPIRYNHEIRTPHVAEACNVVTCQTQNSADLGSKGI